VVVTGEDPVYQIQGDQHLSRTLGHMIQINPSKTLKKMSKRLKGKNEIDQWHKANTPENTIYFCQSFKTSHSLAVANWNLRRVIFAARDSGEARATLPPTLFTEEDKVAILDRRQVGNIAEVIAAAQAANAQVLRDISIEQPEVLLLQRACDMAGMAYIPIGEVFEMKAKNLIGQP
jgi:hypothetical protein